MPDSRPAATSATGESPWLLRSVLVLAGLFVFWPALHGGWLWDDYYLFVHNADMRTFGGLERIWFGHTQSDYWPLTSTALWLEIHFWANHPMLYHLTSLALHLCSAFLLWELFARLGLEQRWAWLGALLFVIHPLVVESVAWASEIKNTLSLPLYLLALHAWLNFDEGHRSADYRRSLVFYLLAMLAKTSVITLPVVMLLYAWWKRRRVTLTDLKSTAPFFLIALVFGIITRQSQSNFALADETIKHLTILSHLACTGTATFFYLGQFFFPLRMLPIYPRWNVEPPTALQLATLALIALVLVGLWTQRKSWGRHALFGFGFFLLNLLPVSGLVTMSYMNFSWVADHLAYLPMIGLIGLVVATLQAASAAIPASSRSLLSAGVFALCLFLAWSGHVYAGKFMNEETLWTYAERYNPGSWQIQSNLVDHYLQANDAADALRHAELALKLEPSARSYVSVGDALSQIPGRGPDAIAAYQSALARDPAIPRVHAALGHTLETLGQMPDALAQYREAITQDPSDPRAHIDLADALVKDPAQRDEAIKEYRAALKIMPDDAATHMDLADVLAATPGRLPEALPEFQTAVSLAPYMADIHNGYGGALLQMPGRLADAAAEFQAALKIRPNFVKAHYGLGIALTQMPGHQPDAAHEFETVLQLDPSNLGAHFRLAVALAQIPGRETEAIPHLQLVVQAKPDFVPAQQLLAKLQAGH